MDETTQSAGAWLDLGSWPRASHFAWFNEYELPFFNVCSEIDVSALYESCRPPGASFFLATLYQSARAANDIEAFRLRVRGGRVWRHNVVHPGSAIMRNNQTFAFAQFEYLPTYAEFASRARPVIERMSSRTDPLEGDASRDDVIYYSVLPWIRFTSFSNARRSLTGDCIPRIVFGRHFERGGRRYLPISVEVHHALVDGLDVGRFLERFSDLADTPL